MKPRSLVPSSSGVAALVAALLLVMGCAGPNTHSPTSYPPMSGIQVSVSKILLSPLAFDGARVAVVGAVHHVTAARDDKTGETVTRFFLTDPMGNHVTVVFPGAVSVREGETVAVGGIYRRSGNLIEGAELRNRLLPAENTR